MVKHQSVKDEIKQLEINKKACGKLLDEQSKRIETLEKETVTLKGEFILGEFVDFIFFLNSCLTYKIKN